MIYIVVYVEKKKMSGNKWITDEIIDDMFDTKYELTVSEKIRFVDGIFKGFGDVIGPSYNKQFSTKDDVKYSVKLIDDLNDACVVVEWKISSDILLDINDIKSILKDTQIKRITFYRSDIYYVFVDRTYLPPNIDFSSITSFSIDIKLTPNILKGG